MTIVRTTSEALIATGEPTAVFLGTSLSVALFLGGSLFSSKDQKEASADDVINALIRQGDFTRAIDFVDSMTHVPSSARELAKMQIREIEKRAREQQATIQQYNQKINNLVEERKYDDAIRFVRGLDLEAEEKTRVVSSIEEQQDHSARVDRFNHLIGRGDFRAARGMVDEFVRMPKEARKKLKKDLEQAEKAR